MSPYSACVGMGVTHFDDISACEICPNFLLSLFECFDAFDQNGVINLFRFLQWWHMFVQFMYHRRIERCRRTRTRSRCEITEGPRSRTLLGFNFQSKPCPLFGSRSPAYLRCASRCTI